jgi:hypothetical protein
MPMTIADSLELETVWGSCVERLKGHLSYNDYVELVVPLEVDYSEGTVRLTAPTKEIRADVERRIAPFLRGGVLASLQVALVVSDAEPKTTSEDVSLSGRFLSEGPRGQMDHV